LQTPLSFHGTGSSKKVNFLVCMSMYYVYSCFSSTLTMPWASCARRKQPMQQPRRQSPTCSSRGFLPRHLGPAAAQPWDPSAARLMRKRRQVCTQGQAHAAVSLSGATSFCTLSPNTASISSTAP
jgi:hypothetical protein